MNLTIFIFSFCVLIASQAAGNRVKDKIYRDIISNNSCFRRMNATHQIGCTSDANGNVGILHVVRNNSDIDNLLADGPNAPYILLLDPVLFTMKNMAKIKNSGKVNGILVPPILTNYNVTLPNGFSPESSCPNENFGLYTSAANPKYAHCSQGGWLEESNPTLGAMYEDWGFPISMVAYQSDFRAILGCFFDYNIPMTKRNHDLPMCSVEMTARMSAAKDTPTCMRRSRLVTNLNPSIICDPLGDLNLGTMLGAEMPEEERSLLFVIARLDTSSIFHTEAFGADSVSSGLAAFLAVANSIAKVREDVFKLTENKTNIVFMLFNGEAFDYIGSSRYVYDMIKKNQLSKISHIIELNQLFSASGEYWLHTDPVTYPQNSKEIEHVLDILKQELGAVGLTVKVAEKSMPLPPVSTQSFLAKDRNISAVVLTNFNNTFTNEFYNGAYDDISAYNINAEGSKLSKNIADLSTAVARTVFRLATNKSMNSIKVEEELVHRILECYLANSSCLLNRQALPLSIVGNLAKSLYPKYVSIGTIVNGMTVSTSYLFQYLTGSFVDVPKENCVSSKDHIYNWIAGPDVNSTGVCYRSSVFNSTAVSPAFINSDWDSTEYSTWTESRWNGFSIRLFVKQSFKHELVSLMLGLIITILSTVFIYFVNKRAEFLFNSTSSNSQNAVPC